MNENGGDQEGTSRGKPWERSWTTDEMHRNAQAWNLAGDAGLLKHLQEFSQTVLSRTHTTEKALDSLAEEINTLTSEANTTNNKFLCLANTQFVENRVYDDDDKETPQTEAVPEKKSKEETEAKMLQKVREALSMSVAVLDTMFEPVEIQASDSDGELESEKQGTRTLILEPHNPYIHRPLPHLIGSEAFMTDDSIGLRDAPSDGEEESMKSGVDDMEASDSDVDLMPPGTSKRGRDLYSSQSSMSDHIFDKDTLPKKMKPIDPFGDDSETTEDTIPTDSSIKTSNDFAAQLAAKLDKIASPPAVTHSNRDLNPKKSSDDLFGGVVSDEEDALFSGNAGLFSGRSKLFDDEVEDTNESLWGPKSEEKGKSGGQESDKTEELISSRVQQPKLVDDLFCSMSDEDDLFSTKTSDKFLKTSGNEDVPRENDKISPVMAQQHQRNVSNFNGSGATSYSLNKNEEDKRIAVKANERNRDSTNNSALDSSVGNKQDKKPTGGVPMFGKANVLAGLKAKLPRRASSSSESSVGDVPDSKSDLLPSSKIISSVESSSVEESRSEKASNKDPNSSHHSLGSRIEISPPTISSNKDKTRNILNFTSQVPVMSNEDNGSDGDDLFSSKASKILPQGSQEVSGSLFAELNEEEDDDLFSVIAPGISGKKNSTANIPQHAGRYNESKVEPPVTSVSSEQESGKPAVSSTTRTLTTNTSSRASSERSFPPNEVRRNDIYSTVPPPLKSEIKVKKPVSLFDDSDSGEDELLFSSASSAGSRRSQASTDILSVAAVSTVEKKPLSKKGLFDDDEALFGSTINDPDIDIFSGSSKPNIDDSVQQKLPQPFSNSGLNEEDFSSQNESDVVSQDATFKNHVISPKALKPNVKKTLFEDDLFLDKDISDDLFNNKSNEELFKKGETTNDSIEDGVFKNTSAGAKMSSIQPEVGGLSDASTFCEEGDHNFQHSTQTETSQSTSQIIKNENPVAPQDSEIFSQEETPVKSNTVTAPSLTSAFVSQSDHVIPKKPEPPRTLNIRNETDPGLSFLDGSDDDDDLFSSISSKVSKKSEPSLIEYPKATATNLFSTSTSKVDQNPVPASKQPSKPSVAAKPASHISSVATPESKHGYSGELPTPNKLGYEDKKSDKSEVDGAAVSVSKLRSSLLAGGGGQAPLKLDPSALLPGKKPPPRRTPSGGDAFYPAGVGDTKQSKSISNEQSVGFDKPLINNATLPSANKDRAKLGVKRRPPSSKARRDAARASQNLDQSDKDSPISPDVLSERTNIISDVNISIASSNSVLSPSTDEDDLFGVPQDLPSEYGSNYVPSTDIFSGAPILSPVASGNHSENVGYESKINHYVGSVPDAENTIPQDTKLLASPKDTSKSSSDKLSSPLPGATAKDCVAQPTDSSAFETSALSKDHDQVSTNPPSEMDSSSKLQNSLSEPDVISSCLIPGKESYQTVVPISSPLESTEEKVVSSSVGSIKDALKSTAPVNNKATKHYGQEAVSSTIAQDPLNKLDHTLVTKDEESTEEEDRKSDCDDHSSLFPFVKKKPESKPMPKQPLFSQTPALPSKAEKSVPKSDLGGLDDVEDNNLFASSGRPVTAKKSTEIKTTLKGKETKAWNFSDEDDDDLFQSTSKSLTTSSSSKGNSFISAPASVESENPSKVEESSAFKQNKPKVPMGKSVSQNGIFSDEDDADDLFSKPSLSLRSKVKDRHPEKSSLFDDDDDDLFGSKQVDVKKTPTQNDSRHVSGVGTEPSKLKKEDVFDDPLKALQND